MLACAFRSGKGHYFRYVPVRKTGMSAADAGRRNMMQCRNEEKNVRCLFAWNRGNDAVAVSLADFPYDPVQWKYTYD